ncbi:hypothetical protein EXS73_03835 [Candidatus Pacearchaeota archaeon]|nr:hypothetical protein [Candidatus Pacearchaeota archaeon]
MQVMRSQRGVGPIGTGIILGTVFIVLFLLGMGALRFFSDEHLCIQRISFGESGETTTVQLHIDVNSFNPPSSFLLEESIPAGWTFVDASIEPTSVRDGTYSWFFWRGPGMLPVKDGLISYRVRAYSADPLRGVLIVGNFTAEKEYLHIPIPLGGEKLCV